MHVGGDVLDDVFGAGFVTLPNDGFSFKKKNDAFEGIFDANRKGHDGGFGAEFFVDFFDGVVKVSSQNVHLVDESNAGNFVFVGLAPDGLGLRLDS